MAGEGEGGFTGWVAWHERRKRPQKRTGRPIRTRERPAAWHPPPQHIPVEYCTFADSRKGVGRGGGGVGVHIQSSQHLNQKTDEGMHGWTCATHRAFGARTQWTPRISSHPEWTGRRRCCCSHWAAVPRLCKRMATTPPAEHGRWWKWGTHKVRLACRDALNGSAAAHLRNDASFMCIQSCVPGLHKGRQQRVLPESPRWRRKPRTLPQRPW